MKNTNAMIAHERIRKVISESGMKQSEIVEAARKYSWTTNEGKLVYVSKNDLSQYMNGKSVPGNWKASILGKVLNVSPVWLMGFDVPMAPLSDEETRSESEISSARSALLKLCNEAPEEQVSMLYRLVAAALNVKV